MSDLFTILQIKLKVGKSCLLAGSTCKDEFTSNAGQSRERFKENTSNFKRIFSAARKNFLALQKTCQDKPQT